MFGFTPLATIPLAAAQAGVSAVVALASVLSTGSITATTVNVSELLASVSATGSVGIISPNPDEVTNSVGATVSVGTVQVNLSELLSSVSATGSVATVGYEAIGNHTLASVAGTAFLEPITAGGFEIDISERLLSVAAIGSINAIIPNVSELLNSISSTGSITAVQPRVAANVSLEGVSAQIDTLDMSLDVFEIDVSELLLSVEATGTINTVTVNLTEQLDSVSSTVLAGSVTATGVDFPFDAEAYSTHRTVYAVAQPKNSVVYISPDNRTVYAVAQPKDNVVHITPDNRTVFINDAHTSSKTVNIAA